MDSVKLNLRLLDLNTNLNLVVGLSHSLELANGVGGEASSLGAVVQHQTLGCLIVNKVGGSTNSD